MKRSSQVWSGLAWITLACWSAGSSLAQDGALRIDGIGAQARTLSMGQLLALKHQRVQESRAVGAAGGKSENVVASSMTGATLADVLNAGGFDKLDRHLQRKSAFIAIADDGYQAAFSWAEVFLNDSSTGMLVLWERDGQTLRANEGPLALIALKDSRTGPRHVKRLIAIRVIAGVQ